MTTVAMRSSGRGVGSDSAALDNELCRFNLDGGRKIQRCLNILVDDAGNMVSAGYIASPAFYGIVFDTNVAAAGLTMSGTTLAADGTDANIDLNLTPKGTGALRVAGNSVFQNTADSTTAYQWLDADGGTPILNIDTTNERVGIGTAPDTKLHLLGSNAELRIETADATDPILSFKTTNTVNQVNISLDESSTSDVLSFAGQTASVDSYFNFKAKASKALFARFYSGSDYGALVNDGAGNFYFRNYILNGDVFFGINNNGVAKYPLIINGSTGNVGIGETAPETLVEMTGTAPYFTSHNSTEENIEGGRECIWRAKGEKGDGTEHTLGQMQFSHDGTGDDYKADFILSVNQNGGADTLVEVMRIDSASLVTTTGVIRGATSLWWHVLHNEIASANPGGSGAVWMDVDANTLGGWQLNASTEILEVESGLHGDYDGASDVEIKVIFEVNVDNTGGNVTDTVDLVCEAFYKGTGDTATKTQTQEEAVVVGQAAQYTMFTCTFILNWDETDNVIEAGDKLHCHFNLETDTSEVDDIIVNHIHTRYKTKQVKVEV